MKKVKKDAKGFQFGRWAFLIGVLIAVVAGFMTAYTGLMALVLFILGLVVGFLNITEAESTKFLIAAIALIGGSAAFSQIFSNVYLTAILSNFISFVAAATFIVALKVVVETSEN